MIKLALKRLENFDGEKYVITFEVSHVIGLLRPCVGEILSLDYVKNLCNTSGTWTVTFN